MTPSPSLSPEHQSLLENASWLQRLAESLVRDPHHADDMAQQTMEAALGGSAPPTQQQRPWLARILRNKVHASHRQESRRHTREQRVAQSESSSILHDAVERAEIGKRLTESIMRLEEPFRTTLLMRFHEDQSPKEIARKLGIPASTVRSRIQRGLEKLRENISSSWGKDWQKCYPAVLAFSRAGVSSGLKAGSLLLPLALLVGVTSTLWVVQPWQEKEPIVTDSLVGISEVSSVPVENPVDYEASSIGSSTALADSLHRQTIPSTSSIGGSNSAGTMILKGRILAEETGKPLVGCTIKLWGRTAKTPEIIVHDGPKWVNPEPFVTAEDGTFEFSIVNPHPNLSLTMDFTFAGRISWRGNWGGYEKELVSTDMGDISMQKGVVVKGKVVHEDGTPIQNASISMDGLIGQIIAAPNGSFPVGGRTNENGEFQLNTALPPGPRKCKLRAKNYLLVGPKFIVVKEEVEKQLVTFVVKSTPYIDGFVTLADGSPAAKVHIKANKGRGWIATADTDDKGYFRIHSTVDIEKPFTFTLSGSGFQRTTTTKNYEWGQREVSLTAAKSLSAQIVVRQESNQKPLLDFTVQCTLQVPGEGRATWHENLFPGPHSQGIVDLDGLNAGVYKIEIFTADPKWRLKENIELVLPLTEKQPVEIFVEEGKSLRVKVLDSKNNPIAGSTVVVGDSLSLLEEQAERGIMPNRPESILFIEGLHLLGRAETKEDGIAEIFLPTDFRSGGVHIFGAHLKKTIALEMEDLDKGELEVVVQPLSRIRGQLIFPESMTGEVGLFFEHQSGTIFGIEEEDIVLPNEKGAYESLLDPGNYIAFFMAPSPTGAWSGSGWAQFTPAIGEFHLEEGSTLELDWNVSRFAPGALSGRLLMNGVPQANAAFSLISQGVKKYGERTNAQGYFHFDHLPADVYRVQFQNSTSEHPWGWPLISEPGATVQSDLEIKEDFNFRYRTFRVRPLHPETNEPFPNVWWGLNFGVSNEIQADAEGWVEIAPAPYQAFNLSYKSKDITYLVQGLQMESDKIEQSISKTAIHPTWR